LASRFGLVLVPLVAACGSLDPDALGPTRDLSINEVVSDNAGVFIDERGETEDYVELFNRGDRTLELSDYLVVDRSGEHSLPRHELEPGENVLLWADEELDQGPFHLPFKISKSGELITLLRRESREELDRVQVPPLEEHQAFQRQPDGYGRFGVCGFATPGRSNGERCGPPPPPAPPGDLFFLPFDLPEHFPPRSEPLAISELGLAPVDFIELENTSGGPLALDEFSLRISTHSVGVKYPGPDDGVPIALPARTLADQERVAVPLDRAARADIQAALQRDGVVSLFGAERSGVDRVDLTS
jgi:hypothetical protein